MTNIDSQETIFSKRGEYTHTGNEERKFPQSDLVCQLTEKKKRRKQILSATKELMKYFQSIVKVALGHKKCHQPVKKKKKKVNGKYFRYSLFNFIFTSCLVESTTKFHKEKELSRIQKTTLLLIIS